MSDKRKLQLHSGRYRMHCVTQGVRHCHADCEHLDHLSKGDANCRLFLAELVWDKERTIHGNIRCSRCRAYLCESP